MDTQAKDRQYIAGTYARFPLCLVSGKGAELTDDQGKVYIDLGSGIAVNSFGVADEIWQAAVTAQLGKLQHTSNLFYTQPAADLAELLCLKTGMDKVFFSNSGAEANECALKLARLYGTKVLGYSEPVIVTLKNSFHGRTLATLAATGQDHFHEDFLPLMPGFVYTEAEDIAGLEKLISEQDCAAILMEVVQGEGGVYTLSAEYVQAVRELAQKYNLLIMADEVQCGNGRSGKLFAYMHYGFTPDVVTTAKGLGGGLPIGATLMAKRVAELWTPGSHGSTFGGNPVVAAGALSILRRLDEPFLAEVQAKGEYLRRELEAMPGVISVSGLGLMLGVETVKPVAKLIEDCRERGLLVLNAKQKLRLLPPLNISHELLEKAIKILRELLSE